MPRGVEGRLEKKNQRNFLWGGGPQERKCHLVSWKSVFMGKEKGGLGIRQLDLLNRALLGMWAWWFAIEGENKAWKICVKVKHGFEKGRWFTKNPRGSYGICLWKFLNREAVLQKQKCSFQLGNCEKIRFWEDRWCGENPICVTFPNLYRIASSKEAQVADVWVSQGGNGAWGPKFARTFRNWGMFKTFLKW